MLTSTDAAMYTFRNRYRRKAPFLSAHTTTKASRRVQSIQTRFPMRPGTFPSRCPDLRIGWGSNQLLPELLPGRWRYGCSAVGHDDGAVAVRDNCRFQAHSTSQDEHGQEYHCEFA